MSASLGNVGAIHGSPFILSREIIYMKDVLKHMPTQWLKAAFRDALNEISSVMQKRSERKKDAPAQSRAHLKVKRGFED